MRKVSAVVLMMIVSVLVASPALAGGHRVGAGVNVLSPDGDLDDGVGGYVSHMFDISDMLATYVGISHVAGDFDLTVDDVVYEGSYTATQLEAAFLVQWHMDAITPYAGMGGGYSYLDFDNMNVGDKLSLFYVLGLLVPVGENLSLEASARLSYLRPRSYNPQVETVDMDAWMFRVGATWDF